MAKQDRGGPSGFPAGVWAVALFLLMAGSLTLAANPVSAVPHRTVLVLYSSTPDMPGHMELSQGLIATLRHDSPLPVEIFNESTDLDKSSGAEYEASLLALYNKKYKDRKVDLLVVVGSPALAFAVSTHFMENVPIVGTYTARSFLDKARAVRPEVTGVMPALNTPKTLDLILSMYPGTRKIEFILGASTFERDQSRIGKVLFKAFDSRVKLDFLNDFTLEQLEARARTLPDDTIQVWVSLVEDADGREFRTNEPLIRISKASRRPLFGISHEDLGDGILGGILLSMKDSGIVAADLALRVLNGQAASTLPYRWDTGDAPCFDARELARWHIRERSLPPGSRISFETPSPWKPIWKEITLALVFMLAETLLVAALAAQVRRRKVVEKALQEARERYRTVADFAHDWEFWMRPDGSMEYVSPACLRVSGFGPGDFEADPGLKERIVLEADQPAWKRYLADALGGKEQGGLIYRIRTHLGDLRWVEQFNNPVWLPGHRFAGSRGSIRDITIRKENELELETAYEQIRSLKDQLEAENTYYREKIQDVQGSSEILGQSDAMKYLHFRIQQVAPSDTTVLVQGPTGTGKELVAEAIHRLGPRKDRPLVKVNCAALPVSLAESELFGHERGAFTGAQARRKGRFEVADGATLFLDEVGELSAEIQAKLLRVLQDGEFQRVGGEQTLRVDVRVIAATNRPLADEVAAGRFREDLWYRLNVFLITVPPLAQRKTDIPILAQAFASRYCLRQGKPELGISNSVIQALQAHPWPGNVRELQNVIEQAVLVSDDKQLRLPDQLMDAPAPRASAAVPRTMEGMERQHILQTLEATGWKVSGPQGAAEVLDMKATTLRSRMLKLGIAKA